MQIIALVVLGFLLDRLARWAESRGWIYYRNRPRGGTGAVMSGLDPIYNPAARHAQVEQRRTEDDREGEESGGPPRRS